MHDGMMDGGWRMADGGLVDHHKKKKTKQQIRTKCALSLSNVP